MSWASPCRAASRVPSPLTQGLGHCMPHASSPACYPQGASAEAGLRVAAVLCPGAASSRSGRVCLANTPGVARASWVLLFLSVLVSSNKKQTRDCCIIPCKDSVATRAHSFSHHGLTASRVALGSPPGVGRGCRELPAPVTGSARDAN